MKKKELDRELLQRFVGRWETEGVVLPAGGNPAIQISGTDTYRWISGNFFLLHEADVMIGDDQSYTHEIIGLAESGDHFVMQYYNNRGESGTMRATVDNDKWTFQGSVLRFNGGYHTEGKVFTGIWEQLDDKKYWKPMIDIKLTRVGF